MEECGAGEGLLEEMFVVGDDSIFAHGVERIAGHEDDFCACNLSMDGLGDGAAALSEEDDVGEQQGEVVAMLRGEEHGFIVVSGGEDPVTVFREVLGYDGAKGFVVFDEKDELTSALKFGERRSDWAGCGFSGGADEREVDFEGGSDAELAIDGDVSATCLTIP